MRKSMQNDRSKPAKQEVAPSRGNRGRVFSAAGVGLSAMALAGCFAGNGNSAADSSLTPNVTTSAESMSPAALEQASEKIKAVASRLPGELLGFGDRNAKGYDALSLTSDRSKTVSVTNRPEVPSRYSTYLYATVKKDAAGTEIPSELHFSITDGAEQAVTADDSQKIVGITVSFDDAGVPHAVVAGQKFGNFSADLAPGSKVTEAQAQTVLGLVATMENLATNTGQ